MATLDGVRKMVSCEEFINFVAAHVKRLTKCDVTENGFLFFKCLLDKSKSSEIKDDSPDADVTLDQV